MKLALIKNHEAVGIYTLTLPASAIWPDDRDICFVCFTHTEMQVWRILAIEIGVGHADASLSLHTEITTHISRQLNLCSQSFGIWRFANQSD
ncbi:hypothetical protein A3725_27650 [Alcanivorax sp. HI0035]|nr:hypothetical protein A3725_27650 [Alcanivorax sp. HI0035]